MSVTGTWKIALQTPMGVKNGIITINEEGDAYTGTMTGPTGKIQELKDLAVNGNRFTCKGKVDAPVGAMSVTINGKADGDAMNGKMKMLMGAMKFTGERG